MPKPIFDSFYKSDEAKEYYRNAKLFEEKDFKNTRIYQMNKYLVCVRIKNKKTKNITVECDNYISSEKTVYINPGNLPPNKADAYLKKVIKYYSTESDEKVRFLLRRTDKTRVETIDPRIISFYKGIEVVFSVNIRDLIYITKL